MELVSHILLIVLFLFVLVFLGAQFFAIVFRGFAPFIPTRPLVVNRVLENIELNNDSVVYELGCGRAGFLRAVRKKYPQAKLFGVELFFYPYLTAQIQNALTRARLQVLKKNFFDVDLSKADVIYCFLNRQTMAALKEKFETECRPGAQIVSYQFSIPGWEPDKAIELNNLGKGKIFFYKKK